MAAIPKVIPVKEYLHTGLHFGGDCVEGAGMARPMGEYTPDEIRSLILSWIMQPGGERQIDPIQEQQTASSYPAPLFISFFPNFSRRWIR